VFLIYLILVSHVNSFSYKGSAGRGTSIRAWGRREQTFSRVRTASATTFSLAAAPQDYYDDEEYENYDDDDDRNGFFEQEQRDLPIDPLYASETVSLDRRRQDEWIQDEEEDQEMFYERNRDEQSIGNYWSNPKASLDMNAPAAAAARRYTRQQQRQQRDSVPDSSARPRRSSIRSGTPPPPAPIVEFYNRLFWYGMDPSFGDSDSDSDTSRSSGTKGKFNGLAYLNGQYDVPSRNRQPRKRSEQRQNQQRSTRIQKPLHEELDTGRPPSRTTAQRERRSQPQQQRERPQELNKDFWVAEEVSGWFQSDNEQDEDSKRSRPREQSATPLWANMLDRFLGLDKNKRNKRAAEYDAQMGFSNKPNKSQRRRTRRDGYAYPVDTDQDDEFDDEDNNILDVDPVTILDNYETSTYTESASSSSAQSQLQQQQQLSWQDRALAVERVPPAGVAAWGPTGDLRMDARTKAIADAREDITQAQRRTNVHETLVEQARDELSVCRVNAELERKRRGRRTNNNNNNNARVVQERLRAMDLQVQDAARALRYAETRLAMAKNNLETLEARHWVVLNFSNPNVVETKADEPPQELSDNERLYREQTESD
jgi:hypothetical protein